MKSFFNNNKLIFHYKQLISFKTYFNIHGKNSMIIIGCCTNTRSGVNFIANNGKIVVGSGVFFNHNCCITSVECIEIGNKCSFGPNVMIFDHDHNYRRKNKDGPDFISSPITIGNNVWVGANAVILRGATIGNNCVIAAGTVVRGNIPNNTLVYSKNEIILKPIE